MFRFAIGNLLSRPLRSLLSILGLTVAIGGMVGLFSIAGGIRHLVGQTFELIPGLVVQQRGAPVPLFSTLPAAWEAEIAAGAGVRVVNAETITRINVIEGKTIISPPRFLVGMDIPSRLQLERGPYRQNLVAGRFLTIDDAGTKHCVISRQIAEEFRKGIGDTIVIGRQECHVVGVYHTGSMMLDGNILFDLGTAKAMARYAPDSVSCYYVELDDSADRPAVKRRIERLFAGRDLEAWSPSFSLSQLSGESENPMARLFVRLDAAIKHLASGTTRGPAGGEEPARAGPQPDSDQVQPHAAASTEQSPVEVRSAEDWSERFDELSGDLNIFLMLITAVGIVIAVLSIVNTMLMSVTERTIEFGILRANGWSKGDIVRLITFESLLLGGFGGVLGALGGWTSTVVLNSIWPDRLHLFASFGLLAFSVLFSTVLGLIGGVYPAWLAARMSPMAAIRRG